MLQYVFGSGNWKRWFTIEEEEVHFHELRTSVTLFFSFFFCKRVVFVCVVYFKTLLAYSIIKHQ